MNRIKLYDWFVMFSDYSGLALKWQQLHDQHGILRRLAIFNLTWTFYDSPPYTVFKIKSVYIWVKNHFPFLKSWMILRRETNSRITVRKSCEHLPYSCQILHFHQGGGHNTVRKVGRGSGLRFINKKIMWEYPWEVTFIDLSLTA